MAALAQPFLGLALLAFIAAVVMSFTGPIMGIPAESMSRACTNLALLSIAMMMAEKGGSAGDMAG